MKILILGADGMIGHKMAQTLSNYNFEIHLNTRSHKEFLEKIFPKCQIHQFDFLSQDILELLIKVFPDFILNTAGITIRRGSENFENAIKLNFVIEELILGKFVMYNRIQYFSVRPKANLKNHRNRTEPKLNLRKYVLAIDFQ